LKLQDDYKPYLRDGVDAYVDDQRLIVTFVFLSTRQRLQVKAEQWLIQLLPLFDGTHSIAELSHELPATQREKLHLFLGYLQSKGLLVDSEWLKHLTFDDQYTSSLQRQLNFMLDILGSPKCVSKAQKKIQCAQVAIFGLGAVGSALLLELLQMGFQNFVLVDGKDLRPDSSDRHTLPLAIDLGLETPISKVDYFGKCASALNPNIRIRKEKIKLTTDTELDALLDEVSFVINFADEPYIGYTSLRLSRYCVANDIPMIVGGGFDAHLASMGELIIPKLTPCSDCYNNYFQESLKNWKPIKHVVRDRSKGIGGLKSMSKFAASSVALKVFRYFLNTGQEVSEEGGRGEFKFRDYSIDHFSVKRNANCAVCGD
jgi:molybdopterin/thiamine biosynthesis adenylyltransferase